jgi:hypothetical protein
LISFPSFDYFFPWSNTMATKSSGMSSAPKPTVVVVQGSFQTPFVYEALEKGLKAQGYPLEHPTLPSCSNTDSPDFPLITLADDAAVVRRQVTRLVEENKTVVLVMHSYGGLVGNEAIPEGLSYSDRQSRGFRGGVIHLFMFAAFLIEEGKSVLDAFGESPNNDVKVHLPSLSSPHSNKP